MTNRGNDLILEVNKVKFTFSETGLQESSRRHQIKNLIAMDIT